MKRIIFYCVFCVSGLFASNIVRADNYYVDIDLNFCNGNSEEFGLYSNGTNCQWFYQCINGQTTARQCGPGLLFDVLTKTCTLPWLGTSWALNCPFN